MRGIQGALIVASTLQIIIGFSGLWRNVTRLVSIYVIMFAVKFTMIASFAMMLINCLNF